MPGVNGQQLYPNRNFGPYGDLTFEEDYNKSTGTTRYHRVFGGARISILNYSSKRIRFEYFSSGGLVFGVETENIQEGLGLLFSFVFENEPLNNYDNLRGVQSLVGVETRETVIGPLKEVTVSDDSVLWSGMLGELEFYLFEHKYAGSKLCLFVDDHNTILDLFDKDIDSYRGRDVLIFQYSGTTSVMDQVLEWVDKLRHTLKLFNGVPIPGSKHLGSRSWSQWLLEEGSIL